jgi:hypothetical protein
VLLATHALRTSCERRNHHQRPKGAEASVRDLRSILPFWCCTLLVLYVSLVRQGPTEERRWAKPGSQTFRLTSVILSAMEGSPNVELTWTSQIFDVIKIRKRLNALPLKVWRSARSCLQTGSEQPAASMPPVARLDPDQSSETTQCLQVEFGMDYNRITNEKLPFVSVRVCLVPSFEVAAHFNDACHTHSLKLEL